MTNNELKKIMRLLKELYKELEHEAMESGVSIFSETYKDMQAQVRMALLKKMGYTLDEYREAKDALSSNDNVAKKIDEVNEGIALLEERVMEVEERHIPDEEEISEIVERLAKPPVVNNTTIEKIVKETTVEKPIKETIIEREEYEDGPIWAEIGFLADRLENLPEPSEPDYEELKEELRNDFADYFEHNINTLDMPDFRKLAMGIQDQVDRLKEYNITSVTSDYEIRTGDSLIIATGTVTITLPTAVGFKGQYSIKNIGTGTVTVATRNSETIDADLTEVLIQHETITLRSDGTNWWII
jgi:hypothetical protein